MTDRTPRRGEIWQVVLDPVVGHEQGGERPAVVLSSDFLNEGPSRLAVVVPVSRRDRGNLLHVRLEIDQDGLRLPSFALCDMIRSVSHQRLRYRRGQVDAMTLQTIRHAVLRLLELD